MQLFTVRLFRALVALAGAGSLFSNFAHASSCGAVAGQAVTLSVAVQGTAPFSYQWQKNGVPISAATNASYSISSVSTADAASYAVAISNAFGSTTSDSAVLTVNTAVTAPSISTQPTALTVNAGQPASFSVAASGSATLTYQWYKNGAAISGATSTTYSIAATTSADAASYSVVVANSAGSVTSSAATLTVNAASTLVDLTPQSFSASGQNSVSEGVAMLFDGQVSTKWLDVSATHWVTVVFASPTVLQDYGLTSANDVPARDPSSWTLSGSNDGVTWTVIETRTAQSWSTRLLTRDFILAQPSPAFTQFRLDLQPTTGSILQLAELELFGSSATPVASAPAITTQPTALTVNAGQPASFSVAASGSATLTYQWRKNGAAISGATSATYSIAATSSADAASYSVVVSNSAGSVTSNAASLTVNTVVVVTAPSITTQPKALTVNAGQPASFSVAASGSATLTYQWRKNGTTISGATSATYSIAATSSASAGNYSVVVANSAGSVTSNAATLTVNAVVTAPSIKTQPKALTVSSGKSASFTVVASGTAPTYQWRKNGVAISGATSATYTIASTTSADAASYSVVVANSAGSVTSKAATLTVNVVVTAPSITTQPKALTVNAGQPAAFFVAASGTAPSYQWRKNGVAISGATSATYSIAATVAADAASYSVVVSNSAGSATSNAATLTVNTAIVDLTPQSFSASGQNSISEGIAMLFDGQVSTKWLDVSATHWVKVVFASPTVLQAYSLTSANDVAARDPSSWTLSGSNDGVTWTVIETRSAQSWSTRLLTRDFILAKPSAAFTQFRLDLQPTTGSILQLAELELFGSQ